MKQGDQNLQPTGVISITNLNLLYSEFAPRLSELMRIGRQKQSPSPHLKNFVRIIEKLLQGVRFKEVGPENERTLIIEPFDMDFDGEKATNAAIAEVSIKQAESFIAYIKDSMEVIKNECKKMQTRKNDLSRLEKFIIDEVVNVTNLFDSHFNDPFQFHIQKFTWLENMNIQMTTINEYALAKKKKKISLESAVKS